jgi:V-type H+-transporting ATPase subunit D
VFSLQVINAKDARHDRLKKVQGKKKRDTEAAEAKRKVELAAQDLESGPAAPAAPPADTSAEDETTAVDLLSSKDDDVIF